MIVEFRDGDRKLMLRAIALRAALIAAAQKACSKAGVSTLAATQAEAENEAIRQWVIQTFVDDDGFSAELEEELEVPTLEALWIRAALLVYQVRLTKVEGDQVELLVEPNDTRDVVAKLERLDKALQGQLELLPG